MDTAHRGWRSLLASAFELGPAEADRLQPMEGLRGVAVTLVFCVHYGAQFGHAFGLAPPAIGAALQMLGNTGVDLFFVLSGYLIYGALIRRPRPYGGFLARRVQRLYPAFLVAFGLQLAVDLASRSGGGLPAGAGPLALAILVNLALLPGIFSLDPILVVAWSLSYEMFFYLSVPLLIGALRLRTWPPGARMAGIVAGVALMLATDWHHSRMGMFACGMLLVETMPWLRALARRGPILDAAALLAVLAAAAIMLAGPPGIAAFLGLFTAGFLLPAAAFAGRGPVARALTAAPLRWLGNMSYSYYLLHGLALEAVFRLLRPWAHWAQALGDAAWWLVLPPAFLATLLAAAGLFLAVERPFSILPAGAGRKRGPAAGLAAAE